MSCYLRHLSHIFTAAGLEIAKENRKAVDKAIKQLVGKDDANCPEVWREVKLWLTDPVKEAEMIAYLKTLTF